MSLEYAPGISDRECLAMMKLAEKYNVAVYYHARYSDMEPPGTNIDALNEIIDYAKRTGAAAHIDHINSTGGTFSMKQSLAMLDQARKEGLDITACIYPYNYWATYLNSARFDPGWQTRFHISYPDLQLGGSSERLTETSFKEYQKQGRLVNAFAIPEANITEALCCPWVMIGSDSMLYPGFRNHPRASGTCARLIGRYVRDQKVLSLMDAIAKLTILPAKRLEAQVPALQHKGRIMIGADADIVVFDLNRIIDRATPEHPELKSAGIEYVFVGGAVVKDPDGLHHEVRKGVAIQSKFEYAKFSTTTARWRKSSILLIEYQHTLYLDLGWLTQMGFELKVNRSNRQVLISNRNTGRNNSHISNLFPTPIPKGTLVLERGFTAKYNQYRQTLLSIEDRFFLPLKTLPKLGLKLEKLNQNQYIIKRNTWGSL
jgi:hypothetical protein